RNMAWGGRMQFRFPNGGAERVASWGLWPALPLTGYWLVPFGGHDPGTTPLAPITWFALLTAVGMIVWSVVLLVAALARIYRPACLGLAGWALTLGSLAYLA